MRIRFTKQAFADREAIYAALERNSPQQARSLRQALQLALERLAAFPKSAPLTNVAGIRELVIPGEPYKIFYVIRGPEVRLLHIRDARRVPFLAN